MVDGTDQSLGPYLRAAAFEETIIPGIRSPCSWAAFMQYFQYLYSSSLKRHDSLMDDRIYIQKLVCCEAEVYTYPFLFIQKSLLTYKNYSNLQIKKKLKNRFKKAPISLSLPVLGPVAECIP